jgi:hypothetical protein
MQKIPQHLEIAVIVLTHFVEKVKGKKFDVGAFLRKPEIMYCTNSRNAVKLEEVVHCEPIMPYWEEAVKASEAARAVNIPVAPVPTAPRTTQDGFVEVPSTSSVPCVSFAPVEEIPVAPVPAAPSVPSVPPSVPPIPEAKKGKK